MDFKVETIFYLFAILSFSYASQLYMSSQNGRSISSEAKVHNNRYFQTSDELTKEVLESLDYGLYVFSTNDLKKTETIAAGSDVSIYCMAKIDHRRTCLDFGNCPTMKFEWNFPLTLSEEVKSSSSNSEHPPSQQALRDARVYINTDPVIGLNKPDDQVHLSTLTIESVGSKHEGKWLCNFKYFDEMSGKFDRNFMQFTLNVETYGEDVECEYGDHCTSGTCINSKCTCTIDYPIYNEGTGACHVASYFGNECEFDEQCSYNNNRGSICAKDPSCSNLTESADEQFCPKTCQCKSRLDPVTFAFNNTRCYPRAYYKSRCESSEQCELSDPNTYCSFNQICECKESKKCSSNQVYHCQNDDECPTPFFCRYSKCVISKGLHEICTYDEECKKNDGNSTCKSNKCRCDQGFKVSTSSDAKCIKYDECLLHSDCEENSFCIDQKCTKGKLLGEPCEKLIECKSSDMNSICSIDGVCTCRSRYQEASMSRMCIPIGHCLADQDCAADSFCQDGKCFDDKTGATCRDSLRCVDLMKFSFCNPSSKRCECDNNYNYNNLNGTCDPKECRTNNECRNKECINGLCSCPQGKEVNNWGYCVDAMTKEPDGEEGLTGTTFGEDLQRIFTLWTWEAYFIIFGLLFVLAVLICIVIVMVRIIKLRRELADEESNKSPTTSPVTSDAEDE